MYVPRINLKIMIWYSKCENPALGNNLACEFNSVLVFPFAIVFCVKKKKNKLKKNTKKTQHERKSNTIKQVSVWEKLHSSDQDFTEGLWLEYLGVGVVSKVGRCCLNLCNFGSFWCKFYFANWNNHLEHYRSAFE